MNINNMDLVKIARAAEQQYFMEKESMEKDANVQQIPILGAVWGKASSRARDLWNASHVYGMKATTQEAQSHFNRLGKMMQTANGKSPYKPEELEGARRVLKHLHPIQYQQSDMMNYKDFMGRFGASGGNGSDMGKFAAYRRYLDVFNG